MCLQEDRVGVDGISREEGMDLEAVLGQVDANARDGKMGRWRGYTIRRRRCEGQGNRLADKVEVSRAFGPRV